MSEVYIFDSRSFIDIYNIAKVLKINFKFEKQKKEGGGGAMT